MGSMTMASPHQSNNKGIEITYGIYTIERLPKGLKRSPKWDLHSIAKDKKTAEDHAKILSAQPYFDLIEVQEFQTCPVTHKRTAIKIKRYSRKSFQWVVYGFVAIAIAVAIFLLA